MREKKNDGLPHISAVGLFDSRRAFGNLEKTVPHSIRQYELEFFFREGGATYMSGRRYFLRGGMAVCGKPGCVRYSELPFSCYYLHIDPGEGEAFSLLDDLPDAFACDTDRCISMVQSIERAYHLQSSPARHLETIGLLFSLISALHEEQHGGLPDSTTPREKSHDAVQKALSYIEETYTKKCTLADIAAAANFSPIYFHTLFTEITGKTPAAYVNERRLRAAKEMLLLTDAPIAEVGDACGFTSSSYFAMTFHRACGCTPSAYRRQMRLPGKI